MKRIERVMRAGLLLWGPERPSADRDLVDAHGGRHPVTIHHDFTHRYWWCTCPCGWASPWRYRHPDIAEAAARRHGSSVRSTVEPEPTPGLRTNGQLPLWDVDACRPSR